MDEYKLKDYTERLKKETNENAHKMLYMWIKQDVISLNEYQQLVLNLSLQIVSEIDSELIEWIEETEKRVEMFKDTGNLDFANVSDDFACAYKGVRDMINEKSSR